MKNYHEKLVPIIITYALLDHKKKFQNLRGDTKIYGNLIAERLSMTSL